MGAQPLSVDEFFVRLSELFESRRKADHGSIFLVQKRLSHGSSVSSSPPPGVDESLADLHPLSPLPVLIRATNGKSKEKIKEKIKLSTIVQPDGLEEFYTRYAEACKLGMQGLKKRDRSGRKKAKAKKRKEIDGEKKN